MRIAHHDIIHSCSQLIIPNIIPLDILPPQSLYAPRSHSIFYGCASWSEQTKFVYKDNPAG